MSAPNVVMDISTLPAEVQQLLNDNPVVFTDIMTEGMPWIKDHFTVIENDGRTPLWSIEVVDFLRPAGDDWLPSEAIKFGAKVPTFEDIDGDLGFPRSQILKMARTHIKKLAGAGSLKEAVQMKPFAYSFLSLIAGRVGSLLEMNSVFKGVRSNAVGATGSGLSLTGLNFKITAGVASGDIPEENVFESAIAPLTAETAYAEVLNICKLTEANTALAAVKLNIYMNPSVYRLYIQGRRLANAHETLLGEKPTTVDDYDNINIVQAPGLAGTERIFITTKSNIYFCVPDGFLTPAIRMIEDIKNYKTNIFLSACVEYNFGKMVFTNTRA